MLQEIFLLNALLQADNAEMSTTTNEMAKLVAQLFPLSSLHRRRRNCTRHRRWI